MFIPPPTLTLSRAEIEARRARMHNSSADLNTAVTSRTASRSRGSQSSGDGQHSGRIIRKIAALSSGKEKMREPSRPLDISAPLPCNPPSKGLPPVPKAPQVLPAPPPPPTRALPVAGDGLGRRRQNSQASSMSTSSSSSPRVMTPPKRPPRPSSGLLFETTSPTSMTPTADAHAVILTPSGRVPVISETLPPAVTTARTLEIAKRSARLMDDSLKLAGPTLNGARRISANQQQAKPALPKGVFRSGEITRKPSKLTSPKTAVEQSTPSTPSSIMRTPIDLYGVAQRRTSSTTTADGEFYFARSPANKHDIGNALVAEISPYGLTSIPETCKVRSTTKMADRSSTRTRLHLRGGSVVTVTPPELNAWRRTTYIPGPIRLLKPDALPRKNSVATLDPFQDAVDKVFKDGESITKRRSELAVAEDICNFFIDFALGECEYDGDALAVEGGASSETSSEEKEEEVGESFNIPGFEIPPDSPVTRRNDLKAPPVENQETLRVKGIDWLSRQRVRSKPNYLPMIPEPEDSMLGVVLAGSTIPDDAPTDLAAPWIRSMTAEHKLAAALKRRSQ